jgi:hypothetical protein
MNQRLTTSGVVLVIVGSSCAAPSALGPAFGQDTKDPIAALFKGIPADLRSNIRANSVRRDRVNDWLSENIDNQGKLVEMDLPVYVQAVRDADKTYSVEFATRGSGGFGGQLAITVTVLGDTWPVLVYDGRDRGVGSADFSFVGVSAADAEKLVELKKVHVQGKVKNARVNSGGISLILDEVLIDGKKLTPRKEAPKKGKEGKGKGRV